MNRLDELKARLKTLCMEYEDDDFGIFIHIKEDDTGMCHMLGNDCPVCVYEDIKDGIDSGKIIHLGQKKKVH